MGTDADLVRPVKKHLEDRGVAIHLESKVVEIKQGPKKVQVKVQPNSGDAWSGEFDKVLVSIGRRPNTDELGLERAGIKLTEKGFIPVNEQCKTNLSHVFAIGDCTGNPALAHRASHMGVIAAEVIAGHKAAYDVRTVPAVVFSEPEIAYCGMSEDEATKAGYKVKTGRFRFAASGRAKSMDQTEGFVNVIAEEGTEVILGVRMVGPNVSELIAEATLAVETGMVLEDLIGTIHAHPTLAECVKEAAEAVRDMAIHTYRVRRDAKKVK
jgi:dihydrolipoamide dehydrogenase